jgi:hypothetical protein
MQTLSPKEIALAYYDAFYKNDRDAVRKLLADEGQFIGPLSSFTDPEAFLDAAAIFMTKLTQKTQIKAIIAEGTDVCIVYDATYAAPSIPVIPIASWFKIELGKIKLFHVHFDPTAFVRASESGELAKTLATLKN